MILSLGKKEKNIMLVILGIACLSFFVLHNITSATFLFLIGLLVLFSSIFFLSDTQLFFLLFFLFPNIMTIKLVGTSYAWLGYFLILVEVKYFFTRKFLLFPSFVLVLCVVSVTALVYSDSTLATSMIRTLLFFIYVCSFFGNEKDRFGKEETKKLLYYFCYGVFAAVFSGMLYWITSGKNIFGGAFSGIRYDRNYLAATIGTALNVFLILTSKEKKLSTIITNIVFILFLLFAGGLTSSRTFFISLVLFVVNFLFCFYKKISFKSLIFIVALIFVIIICFGEVLDIAYKNVINRFESDDIADANGRVGAWTFYLNLMSSSIFRMLMGNGRAMLYVNQGLIDIVEHSTYVEYLSTIGIVGTLSLCYVYFIAYKNITKKGKKEIYSFIPFLYLLFFYFTLSSLFSDIANTLLVVSFLNVRFIQLNNNEKTDKEKL